jgi:PST family polysaccharide transporter
MVTLINVMAKILVLLGIFLFVRNEDDYLLTAWIQSGGVMIGGLMAFGLVLTSGGISPRIPSSTEIFQSLRDGWHVFISTAGKSLYTNSNVFFLGLLTDPASVGFFSAAEKLVKAVQGLSYPVTQAVFPRINSLLKDSRELAVAFIRKTLKWLGLWTFLMSLFLFLAADPLVHMLFGNRFGVSVELVRWMSFLPLIIALSNVFGVQTMIPFGMKKEFSRILLFSGVFNLGLLIPLVSLFGASGAAVSVVLTELAITFSMYLSLRACGIRFFSCRQFALKLTAD